MGDAANAVKVAKPAGGALRRRWPTSAARRVSTEAFLQGASIAWAHLRPQERKAIRATCLNGRQLHDRLTTDLRINLGKNYVHQRVGHQQHQPSPQELRASLGALVQRGARLHSLKVSFSDPDVDGTQAQLLAALEACSGCPLSRLELQDDVPLSGATAEAVEACCTQLSGLHLTDVLCRLPPEGPRRGAAAAEYHYGYSQLLTLCGPRLRELCLTGMGTEHWRALSYMALRRCTALTRLELQAPEWTSCGVEGDDGGPTTHITVFSTVAQLTNLRSLDLTYEPSASLEDARTHATCVAGLSTLAALTHLKLDASWVYEGHGDDMWTADDMGISPEDIPDSCAAAEAHRASLLSALRCMPQLENFDSAGLWLRPSELVQLTALTSLTLAGLLPPGAGHPSELAGAGLGGLPPAGAPLPPQLHTLDLRDGGSPRALALLRSSPSFVRLVLRRMLFGTSDVEADGRLRAETVEAVGPAVWLILAYRDRTYRPSAYHCASYDTFTIAGHNELSVNPRAESTTGHTEWIRQLHGLDDAFDRVVLEGIDLSSSSADLSCLGHTLSNLKELKLSCEVPVTALPLLRCPMLRLTRLALYLGGDSCEGLDSAALVPLLVALCQPHSGATPLQRLECWGCPESLDVHQCKRSLEEQLQLCFGVTNISIQLR